MNGINLRELRPFAVLFMYIGSSLVLVVEPVGAQKTAGIARKYSVDRIMIATITYNHRANTITEESSKYLP